jgi:Ca2+/Na+ antiporter
MFSKIQNAYLLASAVLLLPVHFFSVWSANFDHITDDNFGSTELIVKQHLSVDVPILLAVVLCVIAIFLHVRPKLQLRLIKAALLSIALFIMTSLYVIHNLKAPLAPNQSFQQEYKLSLLLPLAAIVLLILSVIELWKKEDEIEKSTNSNS